MVLNCLCIFSLVLPIIYGSVISFDSLSIVIHLTSFALMIICLAWQVTVVLKRRLLPFVDPKKKAVVITGCDTGLGNCIARELFYRGFSVYACCLDPEAASSQTLSRLKSKDSCQDDKTGKIIVLKMDVTNPDQINQSIQLIQESTHANSEQVYCLINNAGMIMGGEFEWGSFEEIEKLLAVNLMGVMRVTRAMLPLMRQSVLCSRIINMSSIAARFVTPGFVPYGVSKAAVSALSSGLRRELIKWNIKVIDVQPDLYKTPFLERLLDSLERTWMRSSSQVRSSYASEYFVCFKSYVRDNLKTARDFPEEVVEAATHAVLSSDPDDVYTVSGRSNRVIIFLFDVLPDRVLNFVTSFFFPTKKPRGCDNQSINYINYNQEEKHVASFVENKRNFVSRGF